MRLWTIHPRYLDGKGLVAAWREGLLAQKVLRGETRGYTRHPQLERFRRHSDPLGVIAAYLALLAKEAAERGYVFDFSKIFAPHFAGRMVETRGQLLFEWRHLKRKLRTRAPQLYRKCLGVNCPKASPLFRIVQGPVRDWEKTDQRRRRRPPANQRTSTSTGRR
ncbi:MAG: pyrimidine dimer DNA glycosylase/endonuclease V [Verrucomicrobiaceae bacterium]|nr:pyrimidine dimer DNA glycosylase/endonuclease V [Verrucomicrobiaceae bacterium]